MKDHRNRSTTTVQRRANNKGHAGKRTLVQSVQRRQIQRSPAEEPAAAAPGAADPAAADAAAGPAAASPAAPAGVGDPAAQAAAAADPAAEAAEKVDPAKKKDPKQEEEPAAPAEQVPVQAKAAGAAEDPAQVQAAAAEGVDGPGGALPHGDAIQKSFGKYDVSGVKAHTDDKAAAATGAIGAEAYASGNDVAFAGGAPSLHTAAHEAAHVVQQKKGVQLAGGVGAVGDPYEMHADDVAAAVVAGQSAEGLLDAGPGGGGPQGGVQQRAVQRAPTPPAASGTPNESVDRARMGALAVDTAAMTDLLAACQAAAGGINKDFKPKINAAAGAYRRLAMTFETAREKVVARIAAHDKNAADRHAQVAGAVKFVLGQAIDLALGPEGLAIEAAVGMGMVGKKIVDTVKAAAIDGATALIVGDPPKDSATVPSTAATEHENLKKLIEDGHSLIDHLSVLLQVSSVCGPALRTLEIHFNAHKNGGTATDGTNKPPSQLEASYRKLVAIKGMCAQVDVDSKSIVAHAKAAQNIAEAQADTDLLSAERQIWTRYQDMHPDAKDIADPDSFGDTKRDYKSDGTSTTNESKKDFVRQIGKEAQVVNPINTMQGNPLLPGAGLLVTSTPGSVTINGKTYRALTRKQTHVLQAGASCRVIDALVGADAEGKTAEADWALVVDGGPAPGKATPA